MNIPHPIRVVARVRPSSLDDDETCMQVAPTASQIILGFDNFYDFDAVFGEEVSQNDFYVTCLTDMVTSFFHGYNTTVVSYGQQGTGKTYAMNGPNSVRTMNEEEFGLLPRAVRDIFKMINHLPNRDYRVHISFMIIHQESVYDLLSNGLSSLNIQEDNRGNIALPGITVVDCHSVSDVLNCLEEGLLLRHTASNQGFDLTSAHTMFNFTLEHQWTEPNGKHNYIYSLFNFVDLAGSEENMNYASDEMGVFSNTIKSNYVFNSDLNSLTNIICCLTNKNHGQMVPYRATQLTHLLKDSFGGNSKTLMVCCLSPSSMDFNASFNTMKFGCLTRYVTNFPRLNVMSQCASLPTGISNINNVWSNSNENFSAGTMQKVTRSGPNMTILPQLSQGLPPNLQVVQAVSIIPSPEPHFDNTYEEPKSQKNEDIFKMQFAASQWHLLVVQAEDLFSEILHNNTASNTEKARIESWLCMKAETEECIDSEFRTMETKLEATRLEVIEELSEPSEMSESLEESEVSSSVSSLGENFCDLLEQFKEKFLSITSDLIRETEKRYDACETSDSKENNDNITEILQEKIKNMIMQVDTTESQQGIEDDQQFCANTNDNLNRVKCESEISLISRDDEPLVSSSPVLKQTTNKIRHKVVEKLNGFSLKSKNRQLSYDMASSSDFISADDDDSSGNELLRRVSSKFVSVSKGSSKCVNSFKTRSSQLTRVFRSRIFKKRSKNSQALSLYGIDNTKFTFSPETKHNSVGVVTDDLNVTEQRLKILCKTIKAKEELLDDILRTEPEAETTRKKCVAKMEKLEKELNGLKEQYEIVKNGCDDTIGNGEKMKRYIIEMEKIQKKITSLRKVSFISTQDGSKVKKLKEGITELREEQEELQTKQRVDRQRQQLLEKEIHREARCTRNPIATSKLTDDESDDCDMDETNPSSLNMKAIHSKKRKLVNSTGDSQSETHSSWRGKGRRKAGRLDSGTDLDNALQLENPESRQRKQIHILRSVNDKLIMKRQKIDKKINKGRCENDIFSELRKYLELDEALEGIGALIDLKNLIISGKLHSIEPYSPLLAKIDLEETFRELPAEEIHFILIHFFNRLIDLRAEFRTHLSDYDDVMKYNDKLERYINNKETDYQQACLEMERKFAYHEREFQRQIYCLYQQLNEEYSGTTDSRLRDMQETTYYYKKFSHELTVKLKQYRRVNHPTPGPSGIRSRSIQDPRYAGRGARVPSHGQCSSKNRRHAVHDIPNSLPTRVIRERNKLVIQQ